MNRKMIFDKIVEIIRDIFDNDEIEVKETTTANDVDGWDSLMHIALIGAIEDEFGMKFAMKDVIGMKNVGEMVDIITQQID